MKPSDIDKIANQHIAILGKTGSGKTFTAKGIVEHLLSQKRQVCILDPTSAWWGLRNDASGKNPSGFKIVLIGGAHADVPLNERAGEAVARLVTEQRASVVIDTGNMTVGEYTRWFITFAGTLYATVRNPLHLVIDEAHHFMPQGKSPDVDAGRMLHAGNRLMSGGRSRGIRGMLITQRPAKLHKDSLTCADTLIAMRMIAPQDRQAVKDWVDGMGDAAAGKAVIDSLAQLQKGEGWIWYPEGGILERTKFPPIKTFDSSATPKHGQQHAVKVGEIDLTEVRSAMAEAVKEAEANDPKLLRAKIAELQKQLTAKPAPPKVETKIVEKPAVTDAQIKRVETVAYRLVREGERRIKSAKELAESGRSLIATAKEFAVALGKATAAPAPKIEQKPQRSLIVPPTKVRAMPQLTGDGLTRPEQKILDAMAWLESIGVNTPENGATAFVAGYSPTSTGYTNPRGALRAKGMIEYLGGDTLRLTEAGRDKSNPPDAALDIATLHAKILGKLPGPEQRILRPILNAYPQAITNEACAQAAGYSHTSTGYTNPRGRLRTLGLVEYRDGGVAARSILFPEGVAA